MRRDLNPTRAPIRCVICSTRTTARTAVCRTCTPRDDSPQHEHALTDGRWVPKLGIQVWEPARPSIRKTA